MKYTYGLWATIFVLTFIFGGFFIALTATALAVGASITTGASVADKLESGPSRRELR